MTLRTATIHNTILQSTEDEGLWHLWSILIYILMTNIYIYICKTVENISWSKGQGKHIIILLSKRSPNLTS